MEISIGKAEFGDVRHFREFYRQEANCQIIADSALARGIADPYLIIVDDEIAGYGGVWNRHYEGHVMEFWTVLTMRHFALPMFREFLSVSGATHIRSQSNIAFMTAMLFDCAKKINTENYLFQDGKGMGLTCPGATFRSARPNDAREDPWVLELEGNVVASGGYLTHYNPPYADIYMSVDEGHRGRGFGSYLVQELLGVCRFSGYTPAARCNADNDVSRRTLEKAGMTVCGRMLVGEVQ